MQGAAKGVLLHLSELHLNQSNHFFTCSYELIYSAKPLRVCDGVYLFEGQ